MKRLSDLEMLRTLSNPSSRYFIDRRYRHHYGKLDEDSSDIALLEGILHEIETLDRLMEIADYPIRLLSDTGLDVSFSSITQYYPFVEDGNLPDCLTEEGKKFYFMSMESCKFVMRAPRSLLSVSSSALTRIKLSRLS